MKVTVSAPGKIHLMGEHAVVYGKPALLAAINLYVHVTVEYVGDKIQTAAETIEICTSEPDEYVRHAVSAVKKELKIDKLPHIKITINSEIPAGYHLGSSAATAVGVVGALIYFLKKIWNPSRINQIAYDVEKKMHGNPSGGDNTTVTFGGLLWYRKELEFLKSMWQFPFGLPKELDHFLLIDTGRPKETTREMVGLVRSKVNCQKIKMERIFNRNEEQTRKLAVAMKEHNESRLLNAILQGERTLEDMGVVSQKGVSLIRKIENAGGAGKILGGGGNTDGVGFLLCYCHNPEEIETLCHPYGYSLQSVRLGGEGIRLENKHL